MARNRPQSAASETAKAGEIGKNSLPTKPPRGGKQTHSWFSSQRAPLIFAGLLVCITVAAYSNIFENRPIFDDEISTSKNTTIQHLWPIWEPFCPPNNGEPVTGRPLLNVSFAINYAISGTDFWSYHLGNLIIHIVNALLLFTLIRRTLELPDLRDRWGEVAIPIAFAVAWLWALHPMQTESVTYVAQRAESLVGLFYFLTLYGFLRGATGTRPMVWYAATVIFCLLGMGSKEVMVSAPLMVFLYDRTFVAGSFREAIRRRYGLYLAMASTWLLLAGLVLATNNRGGSAGLGSGVHPWAYLCTQFGAIVHYLRLAIWPHPLVFDYGFYLAKAPSEIIPPGIFLCLLGIGVVVALWRWPKVGFLGVWFFAILAPTSSFVPVKTQTMAEHRMYMPLAAVLACIVFGGYVFGRRLMEKGVLQAKTASTWSLCGVVFIGLVFSGMVFQRNADYRNEDTIWIDTVKKAPHNARAHNNYAMILVQNHCVDQGICEYHVAAEIKPDFLDPHYNLGLVFGDLGRTAESAAEYQKALDIDPEHVGSLSSLGVLYASLGRVDDAIALYLRALKAKPDRSEVHFNYANALVMKKEYPQAIAEYREAFRCKPEFADAYCDLALLLATCPDASVRNGTEAIALAKQAVAISEGKDPSILETLAVAYAEAGQFNQALQTAHAALNLALQQQNFALVQTIRTRAKLYEAGLPYHESEAEPNAGKQATPTNGNPAADGK